MPDTAAQRRRKRKIAKRIERRRAIDHPGLRAFRLWLDNDNLADALVFFRAIQNEQRDDPSAVQAGLERVVSELITAAIVARDNMARGNVLDIA